MLRGAEDPVTRTCHRPYPSRTEPLAPHTASLARTRLLPTLLGENGSLDVKAKWAVSLYEIFYVKSEIKLLEKQEKLEQKLSLGIKMS